MPRLECELLFMDDHYYLLMAYVTCKEEVKVETDQSDHMQRTERLNAKYTVHKLQHGHPTHIVRGGGGGSIGNSHG